MITILLRWRLKGGMILHRKSSKIDLAKKIQDLGTKGDLESAPEMVNHLKSEFDRVDCFLKDYINSP